MDIESCIFRLKIIPLEFETMGKADDGALEFELKIIPLEFETA